VKLLTDTALKMSLGSPSAVIHNPLAEIFMSDATRACLRRLFQIVASCSVILNKQSVSSVDHLCDGQLAAVKVEGSLRLV